MKIVRYLRNGTEFYGSLTEEGVHPIAGDIFGSYTVEKQLFPAGAVQLLSPVNPVNILAIGLNFQQHAAEIDMELVQEPLLFIKATTSVTASGWPIVLPANHPLEVDYEGELAVVIGKQAKDVTAAQAPEYILGYTCANDVSARDCQFKYDRQWARSKSFDTFCPLGPHVETDIDIEAQRIMTRVNGKTVQDAPIASQIYSPAQLVAYLSQNMTLLPGTVILCGTSKGVGYRKDPPEFLRGGDVVEVEVTGIGVLRSPVQGPK